MAPYPLRLYRFHFSTNVERVALALAHKGLEVESVWVDPDDRGEVVRVSGQELVPVLVDGERVVVDSTTILERLEERFPERPLYPADPARHTELRLFVDWFNQVWKRPPNQIVAEEAEAEPDRERIAELEREIAETLPLFEGLLAGRDFLFGDEFSAADIAAFPFLKYALLWEEGDPDRFPRGAARDAAPRRPLPAARRLDSSHRRVPARLGDQGRKCPAPASCGQRRRKELEMHPTLMHEIARYRQADLLREAERARLAHLATASDEPRRWFPFRLRTRRLFRPALGS